MKNTMAMSGPLDHNADRFAELQTFVQVARLGSFSAAARQREVSPSAVSKVVARLVPARPRMAADAFADFWGDSADFDLQAPPDLPAEDLPALDAAT